MRSPLKIAWFSNIPLDSAAGKAIYLQLADGIMNLIRRGKLQAEQKIPSTRELAEVLNINRVTVTKAIVELQQQGWLESFVGRGTYISKHIPIQILPANHSLPRKKAAGTSPVELRANKLSANNYQVITTKLYLDDGYPDPTFAPLKDFYRAYRSQLTRSGLYTRFGAYSHPHGSVYYRKIIADYLNHTRGLNTTPENILSTRGTLMAIHLVCSTLIEPGDFIVSGIPGWNRAEQNFLHAKANHIGVPVDEHGIVVDEIRKLCRRRKIRMVYVTPHHHYPTTVPLRIDRRLELIQLANEYGFLIFEDDYDFDFHYSHRPLLPLASADENGVVLYAGSFSKNFSPAFRIGYLAASESIIQQLSNYRILVDRQGDHILDNAMAELIQQGVLQRSIRKAVKVYKEKRDLFAELLSDKLGDTIQFTLPEGGMTIYTSFDPGIDLERLSAAALKKGLYISNGKIHQYQNYNTNSIRLGFASSTKSALTRSVNILHDLLIQK